MAKRTQLNIRISELELVRLKLAALEVGMPVSKYVREKLKEHTCVDNART